MTALDDFTQLVRAEFGFLTEEYGFQEVHQTVGDKPRNPFFVRFVRPDLEVSIEGIHYGAAAQITLMDAQGRRLGVRQLDPSFAPFQKTGKKAKSSQAEEIKQGAAGLREHGAALLAGDFSVFEQALQRQEAAKAAYQARREQGVAVQKAVEAFEREEWQGVVELLTPYEAQLSKKMLNKLAQARRALSAD